jgi:hypothetical protein
VRARGPVASGGVQAVAQEHPRRPGGGALGEVVDHRDHDVVVRERVARLAHEHPAAAVDEVVEDLDEVGALERVPVVERAVVPEDPGVRVVGRQLDDDDPTPSPRFPGLGGVAQVHVGDGAGRGDVVERRLHRERRLVQVGVRGAHRAVELDRDGRDGGAERSDLGDDVDADHGGRPATGLRCLDRGGGHRHEHRREEGGGRRRRDEVCADRHRCPPRWWRGRR